MVVAQLITRSIPVIRNSLLFVHITFYNVWLTWQSQEICPHLIAGVGVDILTHLNKCFSPVLRGGESWSGILLSERLSRLN